MYNNNKKYALKTEAKHFLSSQFKPTTHTTNKISIRKESKDQTNQTNHLSNYRGVCEVAIRKRQMGNMQVSSDKVTKGINLIFWRRELYTGYHHRKGPVATKQTSDAAENAEGPINSPPGTGNIIQREVSFRYSSAQTHQRPRSPIQATSPA